MNLQFGRDKCEKMHIGKDHDENICIEFEMDTWKDTLKKNINGEEEVLDEYDGKRKMSMVSEKKYLGDIVTNDLKNDKNIKDRINKRTGNVNKIISALNEKPYGKHAFKAGRIMRDSLLLGSMLTNCETWII